MWRKNCSTKKREQLNTGTVCGGFKCIKAVSFQMGAGCLSYNRTKLDETQ